MENVEVRRLALCELTAVVIRPSQPYIFEAVKGCEKCEKLLADANEVYSVTGESFDYADPAFDGYPIYATRSKTKEED